MAKQVIYHGSYLKIVTPKIIVGKYNKDFGVGFYCTILEEQAVRWAKKNDTPILNFYEYIENPNLSIKEFTVMSEEWLDFILNCRSGKDMTNYDLVFGGVANDKVFNTVELFFDGLIDKAEAINRLSYERPNLQICFCTEKALSLLHFEGSERL